MNKRTIYYSLSPSLRLLIRRLYYFPIDFWEQLTRQRSKYQPPRGMIYVGSGAFIEYGQTQLNFLKQYLDLQPHHSVLDVGSGIGRTAVALTTYLDKNARYEGFDVVKMGVDWCQQKITKDFPNFRFTYVPLKNDLYNTIETTADAFTFPYESNRFDRVFLFSVFTHMEQAAVQNYLYEIFRVLKTGGQCLATFFIYDAAIEAKMNDKMVEFNFPIRKEGYRLMHAKVKSANIAFDMMALKKMIEVTGLSIRHIERGYWSGLFEQTTNDFQDIVVLEKEASDL